jgi:urea transporter
MSKGSKAEQSLNPSLATAAIPLPVIAVFRGIGQVFFQDNALTGVLFVLGIAASSPLMAGGAIIGSVIGTAVAWGLKFDRAQTSAGIFGFNATLVGIATFFFFQAGLVSAALLIVGCVVATILTRFMRQYLPFPTYTTPFILTTWAVFILGHSFGARPVEAGSAELIPTLAAGHFVQSTAHGIGQVMFQGNFWTGLLFLAGIAVNNRVHASWVLLGSIVGMLVASHHVTSGLKSLDPERLIERDQFENIRLGLYGYNATLAAVALFLWRRSLIPPLLGILLSEPLTELVPLSGLPALTAPFVLATWLVLVLGWLECKFLKGSVASAP